MIFYTNATHPNYKTRYMAMNYFIHWKTFYVRSCAAVSVRFFAANDQDDLLNYEIQIGVNSNTKSRILMYADADDTTGRESSQY